MLLLLLLQLGFAPPPTFTAVDNGGVVIPGAAICVFRADTTILEITWRTPVIAGRRAEVNSNPVRTDSRGQAVIYLDPHKRYRLVMLRPDTDAMCADIRRPDFNRSNIIREWTAVAFVPAKRQPARR